MDNQKKKVVLNWSSGKDCALALFKIQKDPKYKLKKLFTTLNKTNKRVSMHGIHEKLLKSQAREIGLPIDVLYLEENISMRRYSDLIELKMQDFKNEEIYHSAFGDILLEDVKEYRERQLELIGMKAVFPLWKENTTKIIEDFVRLGFKAIIVAAAAEHFDKRFLGREIDNYFIEQLPKEVDPCGENGEFHTFCYDGPIFRNKVLFEKGEIKSANYPNPSGDGEVIFHFLELLPIWQ